MPFLVVPGRVKIFVVVRELLAAGGHPRSALTLSEHALDATEMSAFGCKVDILYPSLQRSLMIGLGGSRADGLSSRASVG
jgi:hypothetical protein